jgi:hypothetical protein
VTPALQPPSTIPSPPARPRRMVSSTGERLPPPGSAPPSPDEAAAPGAEALRPRAEPRDPCRHLPWQHAPVSGGLLWRRQGEGRRRRRGLAARVSSPPESPQSRFLHLSSHHDSKSVDNYCGPVPLSETVGDYLVQLGVVVNIR